MNILESALEYQSMGFSIIPVQQSKKPYIAWEKYQNQKANENQIKEWWSKYPNANVAIVTGKISNLLVIDIDSEEGIQELNDQISGTIIMPVAESPGGGFHYYFQHVEGITVGSRFIKDCDFRGQGGYIIVPPSTNGQNAYKWITPIFEVTPPTLPDTLVSALKSTNSYSYSYIGSHHNVDVVNCRQPSSTVVRMFEHGTRDNDLFHTANCLIKGGMENARIYQVLEKLIISWHETPDPKWINAKIQSALKRADNKESTLVEEVKDFILSSTGVFLSSEIVNCSQLSSRQQKQNLSKILGRFVDEGVIERSGKRNASFRRIEKETTIIDFLNADTTTVDLKLPFEIDGLVEIMPGNIILIAGEVNAGKTAFLLNIIKTNMDTFNVHYFNSEMGAGELRKRLMKFNLLLSKWTFRAYEQADNFSDVLISGPGNLNIIDFLEVYTDFYEVGGKIAEIHKKLKGAIAIVAIQKNPGVDIGLGGYRSLEKPRLALAISNGEVKIVKAKNWKSEQNPNGMIIKFKLVQGCDFREIE